MSTSNKVIKQVKIEDCPFYHIFPKKIVSNSENFYFILFHFIMNCFIFNRFITSTQ